MRRRVRGVANGAIGALPGAIINGGGSWVRMLPLVFLVTLLAAGCLRVESRRLSGAENAAASTNAGENFWHRIFLAVAPSSPSPSPLPAAQPPSVPAPSGSAPDPWLAAPDPAATPVPAEAASSEPAFAAAVAPAAAPAPLPPPPPPPVPPPPPPSPPPPPKITILVSDGGTLSGAASSPELGDIMKQSASPPGADANANANGTTSDTDLMSPLMAGNVTGLLADLPPGSSAAVSSYGLKIDDMAGMVVPKGYPLEQHVVITNDGYKLGTFRIPYGRSGPTGNVRPPVLLIHGISLASTCWVLNSPAESLAFILADQGYDVWMMNTRGNTFSRSHTFLRDTQPRFWNFAVDEMALIDFRETLKYVQDQTGVKKIGVVGHSQGATLALMALAVDPWLSESVAVLVAMGPCAYVRLMKSVILSSFCRQANTSAMMNLLPPQELIYMSAEMQQTFLNGACQMPGTMLSCLTTMEGIFGASRRISAAQYRRYWQIWPSSTSLGNALQWSEIYNEPKPRFFRNNYGSEYDLSKVKAPVVMLSGTADVLAAPEDVAMQVRNLRDAIKGEHKVADYSHMDFIWDTGASKTVYPIITQTLATAFSSS